MGGDAVRPSLRALEGTVDYRQMADPTETLQTQQVARSRRVLFRDLLVVIAVYVFAFSVVSGIPHPQAGFPLDDSWIHQVVARNLAHDGTLGYVPHVPSSGSSSLLWTFLLAANWKFISAISPVVYSAAMSILLFAATGWGLLAMARKDSLPDSMCWIWALTPALDGNFVWLGMIGMEHLLFVALSVVGIYLWFQQGLRSAIGCALCLAALSLTRPEGVVLAFLALLGARLARRSNRDIGLLAGAVSLSVLASLVANFVTSRSWLPTTYAGRKWLYFGSDKVPTQLHLLFPYRLIQSLLQPWAVHLTHPLYAFNVVIVGLTLLGIGMIISFARSTGQWRSAFLVLWSFVHIAIYMAMLPTRSHGGRYQPLFLALSFPLMFLGAQVVVQHLLRSLRMPVLGQRYAEWGSMLLLCCLCGASSLTAWRTVTRAGIALIEGTHARMGALLIHDLPAHSSVAALDIGRIGFLFGGELGDMGGLTDSSFLPYMRNHRAFDYLQKQKIEYLVWPVGEDGTLDVPQILDFTAENKRAMTEIARFCVPSDLWYISYSATSDAAPCQALFRLRFP